MVSSSCGILAGSRTGAWRSGTSAPREALLCRKQISGFHGWSYFLRRIVFNAAENALVSVQVLRSVGRVFIGKRHQTVFSPGRESMRRILLLTVFGGAIALAGCGKGPEGPQGQQGPQGLK